MKKYILLFTLALIGTSSFLQDVPFEKDRFKERKDEFKLAVENIEAGDANVYAFNYPLAVSYYLKANAFNPSSGDLNYKIGLCYVQFDKYQMKTYFEKAYQLKPTVSQDILFYLGWCYHLESNWTKAIEYYNMFAGKATAPELQPLKTEAFKKIQECKNGQMLEGKKARVWIDNVGKEINTDYPDYAPVISTDEAIMIFTTRRPDTEEMSPIGGYFEDLYISRRVDGVWTKAVPIGKPVNVKGQHDATIGLSPDGHTLYVYNDDRGNGDIYESIDEDGAWSQPKLMEKTINTDGHEPDASLTFDGKRLYFTSDKPGGFGGHDIYYTDWDDEKQKWGDAVNVGPVLNTPYAERSVFIHPDGETMYFASKGHNTMGGYDLFYSKLVDGKWTAPVNLGPPLNTPDDDVQLVVAGNGRYGYCSSYRQGGYGEKDIYVITFLGPEKPPVLSNEDNLIASIAKPIKEKIIEPTLVSEGSNMAILTGIIRDEKTKQPLKAQIVLIDNEANKVIAEFNSDAVSGKYLVSLPGGKNYGIAVRKDGYLFHSENFVIPNESGFRQYNKDADLKKVEVGQTIVLRNIFFDLDKYTLRPESVNELERLIKLLNENPTMKIEISGHTDTRGSAEHNQELSQNRAKAVVDYLIAHGISASRLTYAGYGETKTLISDEAIGKMTSSGEKEEAHQQNRRTEFKILSM
jgi:outer membrane protein OmpA-like peptidoglycan-associated protein/Tol biopolymer transport system component